MTDCDRSDSTSFGFSFFEEDVNPNGRFYLIERLAKNKWQAKYPDGSTKQFRTLKAARAYGIPK